MIQDSFRGRISSIIIVRREPPTCRVVYETNEPDIYSRHSQNLNRVTLEIASQARLDRYKRDTNQFCRSFRSSHTPQLQSIHSFDSTLSEVCASTKCGFILSRSRSIADTHLYSIGDFYRGCGVRFALAFRGYD